jgi:hypothetical protein
MLKMTYSVLVAAALVMCFCGTGKSGTEPANLISHQQYVKVKKCIDDTCLVPSPVSQVHFEFCTGT